MIDEIEVFEVSQMMKKYGGSFVKCLGEALTHADPVNQQKIKDTWHEYWAQYREQAAREKQR